MLFNTLEFGIFFAVVLAVCAALKGRTQNFFLLGASYWFYGAWDWRFLSLMFASTVVDYFAALWMHRAATAAAKRRLVVLSVLVNLGILGFFKYYGFFAENLQALLAALGADVSPATLDIVLPVGISFYTFQSMSYTIDVYRGELEPTEKFPEFALYVSLFPQLVAGPIERATHLLPQVLNRRARTVDDFTEGFHLLLWGLYKKLVVADNMALIVDNAFSAADVGFAGTVVGTLAFAFQIYGDFSGYSDMARGTARMLGFDLMVNFNLPYFATSPQDFWRRWHISLSTWLRDYLYVSLGGNRKGPRRTYVNLLLTMVLGGLWHGAAWTFVIWGVYHGLLLAIHRAISSRLRDRKPPTGGLSGTVWKAVRIAFMFCLTLYGWLIFRAESVDQLLGMTASLFRPVIDGGLIRGVAKVVFYGGFLILVQLCQWRTGDLMFVRKLPAWAQALFYLICFYLIVILGKFDAQSFIYFQF